MRSILFRPGPTAKTFYGDHGTPIPEGTSVEAALKMAGLDWHVTRQQLSAHFSMTLLPVPNYYAVLREPPCTVLSVCTGVFEVHTNPEVFSYFHQFLVSGGLNMDIIGSFDEGRWIWALGKMKYHFTLGSGNDKIQPYLCLRYSHVPNERIRPIVLCVREVDQSVFPLLLDVERRRIRCKSKDEWGWKMKEWYQDVHVLAKKAVRTFENQVALLSRTPVDYDGPVDNVLFETYYATRDKKIKDPSQCVQVLRCQQAIRSMPGCQLSSAKGNWWGVLSGIACYTDHFIRKDKGLRMESAWFKDLAKAKRRALEMIHKACKTLEQQYEEAEIRKSNSN